MSRSDQTSILYSQNDLFQNRHVCPWRARSDRETCILVWWSLFGTALRASWAKQVSLDKEGLMKVTHMLNMGGPEVEFRTMPSALASSQRTAAASSMCVVQFVIVPEHELNEE